MLLSVGVLGKGVICRVGLEGVPPHVPEVAKLEITVLLGQRDYGGAAVGNRGVLLRLLDDTENVLEIFAKEPGEGTLLLLGVLLFLAELLSAALVGLDLLREEVGVLALAQLPQQRVLVEEALIGLLVHVRVEEVHGELRPRQAVFLRL